MTNIDTARINVQVAARRLLADPRRFASTSMSPGWRAAERDWKREALMLLGRWNHVRCENGWHPEAIAVYLAAAAR